MSIELPDLVQRIRVKTDELAAAEKSAARLGASLDKYAGEAGKATRASDDLSSSERDYTRSTDQSAKSTRAATDAIRAIDDALGKSGSSTRDATRDTDALGASMSDAEKAAHDLEAGVSDAASATKGLTSETEKLATANKDNEKSTRKSQLSTTSYLKRLLTGIGVLKAFRLAMMGTIVLGVIGFLAQLGSLLVSLTAGAAALVSALAPLSGALAAIPAGLLAFGTVKVLLGGLVKDAQPALKAIQQYGANSKEAAAALAKLNGPTKAFTLSLAGLQKQWKGLIDVGKQAALPGLTTAMKVLEPLLSQFKPQLAAVGKVIGDIAAKGARMVASGPFSKDLGTILRRNTGVVKGAGDVFLHLVSAIRTVTVVAGPMVKAFTQMAVHAARWIDTTLKGARANGKLADFFKNTVHVVRLLTRTLIDFGVGLFNVLKGGKSEGDRMLGTLRGNAKAFRDWTESVKGKNSIVDFFARARPVLAEVGRLVTAVGKGLFGLQKSVDVAPILKQLRTELLPALINLLQVTGKSGGLVSGIIDLATSLVNLGAALPVHGFATFLKIITDTVVQVVAFGKAHPNVMKMVGALIAVAAAFKAIAAIKKFTGITAMLDGLHKIGPAGKVGERGIRGLIQGLRGAEGEGATMMNKIGKSIRESNVGSAVRRSLSRLKGAGTSAGKTVASDIAKGIRRGGSAVGDASKALLRDIGKGARVGASAALRVGKAAGSAVATGIKAGGKAVLSSAKSLGSLAKAGITAGLSGIKAGASAAIAGLGSVFGALIGPIKAAALAVKAFTLSLLTNPVFLIIAAIVALIAIIVVLYKKNEAVHKFIDAAWKKIKEVFFVTIDAIKKVVAAGWDFITGVVKRALPIIGKVIGFYWKFYSTIIKTALKVATAVVKTAWAVIHKVVSVALKIIGAVVRVGMTFVKNWIVRPIQVAIAVVKAEWEIAKRIFSGAVNVIKSVVKAGFNLVRTLVINPMQAIAGFMRRVWDTIVGVVRDKVSAVIDRVRSIRDRIVGFFANAGSWLFNAGKRIIQGLIDGVKAMLGPIGTVIGKAADLVRKYWPFSPAKLGPLRQYPMTQAGANIMRDLATGVKDGTPNLGVAVAAAARSVVDGVTKGAKPPRGPVPPNAVGQVQRSGLASQVQARLMKQAQVDAAKQNRLALQLPLLSGKARADAIKQINALKTQQAVDLHRVGLLRDVTLARRDRTKSLEAADKASKQINVLRSKLPNLSGRDKVQAVQQIQTLEATRKKDLADAKDAQARVIKAMRGLPQSLQNLLRAQREANTKAQQKANATHKGTTGGGSTPRTGGGGTSSGGGGFAPVRLPKQQIDAINGTSNKNTTKRGAQARQYRSAQHQEAVLAIRTLTAVGRQLPGRDQALNDARKLRDHIDRMRERAHQDHLTAMNIEKMDMARLTQVIQSAPRAVPHTASRAPRGSTGGPTAGHRAERVVNVTIHNPVPEPASTSLSRRLRAEQLGARRG